MKRNEILNEWVGILRRHYDIELVRRHRTARSGTYVEFIYKSNLVNDLTGRQNMLKDAEACGYWVMIRKQPSAKKGFYKGHQVYQLFLTPVHPKKKYVDKVMAAVAMNFTPVMRRVRRAKVMTEEAVNQ